MVRVAHDWWVVGQSFPVQQTIDHDNILHSKIHIKGLPSWGYHIHLAY
jgi:hypothetical protein